MLDQEATKIRSGALMGFWASRAPGVEELGVTTGGLGFRV